MAKKVPQKHGGAVNRFEKGESGNPKGRPPKLLSTIVAELRSKGYERASAYNVVEAFETLMNVPEDVLSEMVKDKSSPMSLRIVGKAMLTAKGWEVLQAMIDRAHGRARQTIDVEVDRKQTRVIRPNAPKG
ncbi:MAG: hypothetical protein KDC00_15160 [Flavobacteriales bacterium]|nr:hypothetical protein [Flavobacteriales bacterium]